MKIMPDLKERLDDRFRSQLIGLLFDQFMKHSSNNMCNQIHDQLWTRLGRLAWGAAHDQLKEDHAKF